MVNAVIKNVPPDEFEEISIHMAEWRTKFLNLAQQGKRIKYHVHNMPTIPKEIKAELVKMNYFDLMLEQDGGQHFLIPKSD